MAAAAREVGVVAEQVAEGRGEGPVEEVRLKGVCEAADGVELLYSSLLLSVPIVELLLAVDDLVIVQGLFGFLQVGRLRKVVWLMLLFIMRQITRLVMAHLPVQSSWSPELRLLSFQWSIR